MTDTELEYHLRELTADLYAVQAVLDRVHTTTPVVRAWVEIESLLEHDLEVHLPAALSLLGKPPLAQRSHEPYEVMEPASLTAFESAAHETETLVAAAIATLNPLDSGAPVDVVSAGEVVQRAAALAAAARATAATLGRKAD